MNPAMDRIRWRRERACALVARVLPTVLDEPASAGRDVAAHIETCLRCQAELARYRKMLRLLAQLREELPEPPPGFVGEVLASVGEAARRRAIRSALGGRRIAYSIGLSAALGASVALLAAARRPGRRAAVAGS